MHVQRIVFLFCIVVGMSKVFASCDLTTYSSRVIVGHKGRDIRVDPGFVNHLQTMHAAARFCNVTVKVTSSFRKQNQPVPGSIVTPASHSNHLVGHAIDMNLVTPLGWCNSKCLAGKKNKYSVCFIDAIKRGHMRWGGDFVSTDVDPVHIDDNSYHKSPSHWLELYEKHQSNC
uniref:Peptidase M15C domain-containing protein n=1 Tax=Ciona intestinalis TaxID=7719 RepID=F6Y5L1_CIOIN